jgi:DNA-directed RNA polymerase specialized sigma24 family protein
MSENDVRRFDLLFDQHRRAVLAYALRRVDDPADAADALAETFLVAWRRLDDVPTGADARPWLLAVARRVVSNQRRGARRRVGLADRLAQELSAHRPPVPTESDLLGMPPSLLKRNCPPVVGGGVSDLGGCRARRPGCTVELCPAGRFRSGRRPSRCGR